MVCTQRSKKTQVLCVVILLLLNTIGAQDTIDMHCNPSIRHRYEDCPKSYCCVRDEFLPSYVYCKKIGVEDENCTTKENETECPCDQGLYCRANIQGEFPSVYGRCVKNVTSTTTPTSDTPISSEVPMTTAAVVESSDTTTSIPEKRDIIDMKCDPSLAHRYEDCPKGYCCMRDDFLPTLVYCKTLGVSGEGCTTVAIESQCPCSQGYYCRANILGQFPSIYGKCTSNDTVQPTIAIG